MRSLLLLIFALVSPICHALIITVDPDNYAEGQRIEAVGSVFTGLSQPYTPDGIFAPRWSDVFATACDFDTRYCPPEIGERVFGFGFGSPLDPVVAFVDEYRDCARRPFLDNCWFGFDVIEVSFDSPTNFVQARFTFAADGPGVLAYDSSGNLVASCFARAEFSETCSSLVIDRHLPNDNGPYEAHLTLNRDTRDISRIVVGGIAGVSVFTEVSYRVPEPSSLWLLCVGLVGLVSRSKRRLGAAM